MSLHIPAQRGVRRVMKSDDEPASRFSRFLIDLVSDIPQTAEHLNPGPNERARAIAAASSNRAAIMAGTLALPPGAFGWVTLAPELYTIWRIQAQMVADIAGVYGVSATLGREQMMYCLFRHATAQAVRDLAVRVGGRILIQEVPLRILDRIATRIGISASRRLVGRGLARWIPVAGALGVGLYARYDTNQVARTAIALFADVADEEAAMEIANAGA